MQFCLLGDAVHTFRNSKSYKEIDGISFLVVIFFFLLSH